MKQPFTKPDLAGPSLGRSRLPLRGLKPVSILITPREARAASHPLPGHTRLGSVSLLLVVALLLCKSTSVLAAPAPSSVESVKLDIDPAVANAAIKEGAAPVNQSGNDLLRVVLALAGVIALILVLKKFATRGGWFGQPVRQGRSVRVISRSPLSPRQQVIVLQVGKRLIVVGESAGSLTALAQITEPDEVAALVGEAASAPVNMVGGSGFAGIFKRANRPFDADVTGDEMPALAGGGNSKSTDVEAPPEDVGGLLEAVRAMRRQFKQT